MQQVASCQHVAERPPSMLDKWLDCSSHKHMIGTFCSVGCVIKGARETAALMFGVPVSAMVGRDLAEFIPRACPSRNAEDLLIVGDASTSKKGGLGGKKTVGKLMPLVSCPACTPVQSICRSYCSANA